MLCKVRLRHYMFDNILKIVGLHSLPDLAILVNSDLEVCQNDVSKISNLLFDKSRRPLPTLR